MWSSDVLDSATLRLNTWRRAFVSGGRNCETTIDAVIRALSNDLDTPTALAAIDRWAEESSETEVEGNNEDLRQVIDTLLGIVI
jgi:L-cysteine:1D-myo-inositol 2-amino-2-deoxy-alpha-D-glucopyranoside ligase